MGQFLAQSRRAGKPFWRTFWVGGTLDQRAADERSSWVTAPLAQTLPATAWIWTVVGVLLIILLILAILRLLRR
jgi:hypothetical protein